jgi:hypothetical protein
MPGAVAVHSAPRLLFVGGVMNVLWIAAITIFVLRSHNFAHRRRGIFRMGCVAAGTSTVLSGKKRHLPGGHLAASLLHTTTGIEFIWNCAGAK